MAQISDTRRQLESSFMNEYWKLRKEIGQPEDRQEYWDEMYDKLNQLWEKFDKDDYITNILLACFDDLEQRSSHDVGGKFYHGKDASLKFLNEIRKKKGLPMLQEVNA